MQLPVGAESLLKEVFEQQWNDFLESLRLSHTASVRYNSAKYLPEIMDTVPWERHAQYVMDTAFALDPLWHGGAYYVQESSSMFLGYVLQQLNLCDRSLVALDVCAAPGGKATQLLQYLHKDSLLVANEIIPKRNAVLRENLYRWGGANVVVTQNNTAAISKLKSAFDLVVVDAPCSGEGLWRKQPAAMNEWSLSQVQQCVMRQRQIVNDVWHSLSDDGYLIYSTCTFNKLENEMQVKYFLDNYPLELVKVTSDFAEVVETDYGYRFLPHLCKGSGFFISILKNKSNANSTATLRHKVLNTNKIPDNVSSVILAADNYAYFVHDTVTYAAPKKYIGFVEQLLGNTLVKTIGTPIAKILNPNKVIFCHELAMSNLLNISAFETIVLDKTQALHYLRKNDIQIPTIANTPIVLCYENVALGFGKAMRTYIKNQLPPEWRLRQ